ncbi:MAG: hypothetical protein J6I61_09880 [Prevotella sp.]|nr:hypothetical protein [Prevotella sp.]
MPSKIETAAANNAQRWPQYGNADEKAMASLVKERFREKMAWLAVQWGDFTSIDKIRPDGANSPCRQPVDYDISGKRFFLPGIRIMTIPTVDGGWKSIKIMGKFGQ